MGIASVKGTGWKSFNELFDYFAFFFNKNRIKFDIVNFNSPTERKHRYSRHPPRYLWIYCIPNGEKM